MDTDTLDLDKLRDDGDTIDLDDTRKLRLRIEHDDLDPFEEYEGWGKLAPLDDYGRTYEREQGYVRMSNDGNGSRPHDFDGNAEKIDLRGARAWWQPPTGDYAVPRSDVEGFRTLRQNVIDLADGGYLYLVLEVLEGEDAYGRPIVVDAASLGGIECFADHDYIASLIADMLGELNLEAK